MVASACSVMKHVSASAHVPELGKGDEKPVDTKVGESSDNNPSKRPLQRSTIKSNFHTKALLLFTKMVDHSGSLLENFQATIALLQNVDKQINRLINKL